MITKSPQDAMLPYVKMTAEQIYKTGRYDHCLKKLYLTNGR